MDAERKLIRERAAEWVCELQDSEPRHHAHFVAWVTQSSRHIEEFLMAATVWKALDEVGPKNETAVEKAIARALSLAARDPENVVRLPGFSEGGGNRYRARRVFSSWRAAAVLAALAVMAGLGWWGVTFIDRNPTYVTAIGEQRTARLADGSIVYLNTASRIQVHFSSQARNIELLEGEALFVVAKDAARPFQVTSGPAVIQAIGTQFNVRHRDAGTRISVIEGRVEVANVTQPAERIEVSESQLLAAGEAAMVTDNGRIAAEKSQDVTDAIAWRERRLVFRGETLENIAQEINRYGPQRRFRVVGAGAREKRFAGSFSADDPQAFIRFLAQYDTLSVESTAEEVVIREL